MPNVLGAPGLEGEVSRLVISGDAGYIHALAANGDVLFHAPVTVGSSYDPSPQGDFEVESVTRDPWWHYQPSILECVPDSEPEATLAARPQQRRRRGLDGAVEGALRHPRHAGAEHHRLRVVGGLRAAHQLGRAPALGRRQRGNAGPLPRHRLEDGGVMREEG